MGSVVDKVKKVANVASLGATGAIEGMLTPPKMNTPSMEAPKPVAPATQQSANVQQSKDDARRKLANQSGRSSSSILDVDDAKQDEEKDILG